MSLTFPQMQHLLNEIKPQIEEAVCTSISVAGDASFILNLKRKACSYHLFISLKERFFRFHLVAEPAALKPLHVPFIDTLSKFLVGETLIDLSLLNRDRIFSFTFKKAGIVYRVVAEFLPRRANCYLLNQLQHIEASLHPVDHKIYDLPMQPMPRHDDHAQRKEDLLDSAAVAKLYAEMEAQDAFLTAKEKLEKELKKQCQRAETRVVQRKTRLNECLQWNSIQHEAMLLQANLYRINKGDKEVVVSDWDASEKERKIELDPLVSPHTQVALFFKKAKKLKAGVPYAEKQLADAEADEAKLLKQQKKLDNVKTLSELEELIQASASPLAARSPLPQAKAKVVPAKPYHVFKSGTGWEIWVGKSAKDNDKLTFQCAHGLDWWMHARDFPGSHVVIPSQKEMELDDVTLSDAAELALRYSKAKGQGAGEVSLTQVKGIVSIKGCPGKVMLSKYKTVRIKLDELRWQRLRTSRI